MKKSFYFIPLLFSVGFCLAQKDTIIAPPYQRYPTIPPFKLLKVDSSSYFTKDDLKKNKPVLIILFDPGCDHCKHETEAILKNIDEFKKIQIVMATNASFEMLKEFYEKYDLQKFENITVGLDLQYVLAPFFRIRNLPYLAMYDKKGNLITTFEGTMKVERILETFD